MTVSIATPGPVSRSTPNAPRDRTLLLMLPALAVLVLMFLLPLALFLLAWALGATSLAALGAALCPGLPAGFLVGALAVRWARQSYLSRRRPP